jgi:uncharacterized protein YkwD
MRHLLLSFLLVACTSPTPTATTNGIREGYWSGSEVSFRVAGGQVRDLVLKTHTCEGGGCADSFGGPVAGSFGTAPLEATLPGGKVSGKFVTLEKATGTWTAKPGGCCQITVVWAATWQSTVGPSLDAGSASTNDAGSSSSDGGTTPNGGSPWGGYSTGTLHPGPAIPLQIPGPPANATAAQKAALQAVDGLRAAAGSPMAVLDAALNQASQAHADFYAQHVAKYQASKLSPHAEDKSFGAGYTGDQFWDRCQAAGFGGAVSAEDMAFSGSPAPAVDGLLWTVYHRLPLLEPRTTAFGYGVQTAGAAVDVLDFAARPALATDPLVVWPWPGMQGVPSSWSGNEGPQPPAPPKGWPSGPVVSAMFPGAVQVADHQLLDPDGKPLPHVWIEPANDKTKLIPAGTLTLYAHQPLKSGWHTARITVGQGVLEWRFHVQ